MFFVRRILSLLLSLFLLLPAIGIAEEAAPIIRWLGDGDARPKSGASGQLEIHFINVGAADCFLLRSGDATMLIDCGNLETAGVVTDYLDAIGVSGLDYAVMTHLHNDHIGGYLSVLEEVPTRHVVMPARQEPFESQLFSEMETMIEGKGLDVLVLGDGDTLTLGEASLALFQWYMPEAGENNNALVIRAAYGDRSALFSADIENGAQVALAERHGKALASDILKMPHHGLAAYMREFHQVVRPQLAIFTNAKHRIHERTMMLTKQRGIDWAITTLGTLVAVTDGNTWQIWREAE